MRSGHVLILAAVWFGAAACAAQPAAQAKPIVVILETEKGAIEIELDAVRAPATTANFLKYVDARLYNDGTFHRTVRPDTETRLDVPIQVIQARMNVARRREGFPPIPIERTSVTGLRHLDGTVSMARTSADTATNEFFICVGDQPLLDFGGKRNEDGQGFAAFGRVVAGMEVVKAIHAAPVAPSRPRAGGAGTGAPPSSQTLMPSIRILAARRK